MVKTLPLFAAPFVGLVACLGLLPPAPAAEPVRVATFNLALYGRRSGEILERLNSGNDPQAQHLAEIIQRVRPDVLVLNEIDYDPQHAALNAFCDKYLAVHVDESLRPKVRRGGDSNPRLGVTRPRVPLAPPVSDLSTGPASGTRKPAEPIEYPHRYIAPSNTGVHSGFDLDRNGAVESTPGDRNYGSDCWGYGVYEGQYAFAVLSRHPIDEAAVRTFQNFRWRDMPGARLPDDPDTPAPADWYSAECLEKFRLSSKNHCDVPITVNGRRIHLLLSHPTPPVFDGAEDRNGLRNHDELRFWRDYVGPAEGGAYLYDDAGRRGGLGEYSRSQESGVRSQQSGDSATLTPDSRPLTPDSRLLTPAFLIVGDLNGDPHDGEGSPGINNLLASPRLLEHDFPASAGAVEQARLQGGANANHKGDPKFDTCDPADNPGPGNLHLDYILASADLAVADSGVFWPETTDPRFPLVAGGASPASSDHRLVWADVSWEGNDE